MTTPARLVYTGRDYASIKAALEEFVRTTRPQEWTDWFESNLGVTLMELVAYTGDVLSFGQDMLALEVFSSTARRYESMLRFARAVGYAPRGATSASVRVVADPLPSSIVTSGGEVLAGTTIRGSNGLLYELTADALIGSGSSQAILTLSQGSTVTDAFEITTEAWQEFQTTQGVVEEDSWLVYVGDPTNPANLWTETASVAFEAGPTRTYDVLLDADGKLTVRFGDGNAGRIPTDDVTVIYRVTAGASGNAGIGTVSGSVSVGVIGGSTTVSVAFTNSTATASGGQDRESVSELRQSIPAFLRTLDKLTTITDYEDALPQATAVALVHADQPLASYSGNVIRVHAWDVETVTFTATSPLSGESSTAAYARYAQIPTVRAFDLQQYMLPRSLACVRNLVVRPTVANVDLEFGSVTFDNNYAEADVHADITAAVVGVFENGDGFSLRLADLYRAVLGVAGVVHFQVRRMVFEHINFSSPDPLVLVTDDFRADTDPTGAAGGPYSPPQDLVVPGTADRVYYTDSHRYTNELTYQGEIDNPVVQAVNLRSLTFDLVIL